MKLQKTSRSRRPSGVRGSDLGNGSVQDGKGGLPRIVQHNSRPPRLPRAPRQPPSDVENWVGSIPQDSLSPTPSIANLDLSRRAHEPRRLSLLPPEIVIQGEGEPFGLGERVVFGGGEVENTSSALADEEKAADGTNSERGSDYYSDDEDFESESAVEEEPQRLNTEADSVYAYHRMCRHLGILPMRTIVTQFGRPSLNFKDLTLSTKDMKATCTALLHECYAWSLDFSGNDVGSKETDYVISFLHRRPNVTKLVLNNNNISGKGIRLLSAFLRKNHVLRELDISGNKLSDSDCSAIQEFLLENKSLMELTMNHNEFRETGGKLLGVGIGRNNYVERLDLSWNHLRRAGAIGICRGLEVNKRLTWVSVAWNGFGYEGCVALADVLARNKSLVELDISSNRINPSAMMELLRGLARNKTLTALKMGHNPITASFSSVLISAVFRNPHMALQTLDLEGIVVDKEFEGIVSDIKKTRFFRVNFDISLPIRKVSLERLKRDIELPSNYNVDPIRMLYMLKEKYRAQDFFWKINKDNDDSLDRDELAALFKEAGIPVTKMVIDKIMEFMDTDGDGTIDMAEFLQGDRRMKRMARNQLKTAQQLSRGQENYAKYSRTFQSAQLDPHTLALKVQRSSHRLEPMPDPEDKEAAEKTARHLRRKASSDGSSPVPPPSRPSPESWTSHQDPLRGEKSSLQPPDDVRRPRGSSREPVPERFGVTSSRRQVVGERRRNSVARQRESLTLDYRPSDSPPRTQGSKRESRGQPPSIMPR